ncbi:MAG: HlyD family efflux transporter periplasmic adaptor subunit [Oscillospiraceae bacterium]|nr:HlyD family efflux transporter periplasmic adaptor subunit [Oscillospiraceae bacterium]
MYAKSRRKKVLIPAAILLLAVLGGGIWFAVARGSEPVNVYPFQYIGMTEFWGDNQESYGPVTTDKIQTEFLSDTQTITEVAVKDGDMVKKGDVLFSFDTTLDALSLERKRLEVEKVKVQIKAAEERLQDTRDMVPYVPPELKEPEEPDLGEELKDKLYKISENVVYDGSKPETALICWLKDGTPVSDAILQDLYKTSLNYQEENAKKQAEAEKEKEESSASDEPENAQNTLMEDTEPEKAVTKIPARLQFNGDGVLNETVAVGEKIVDAYTYQGKTYWLKSAKIKGQKEQLQDLLVPVRPQEEGEDRDHWDATWGQGVEVEYVRSVSFTAQQMKAGKFADFEADPLPLLVDRDVILKISSKIHDLPKEYRVDFSVRPENRIFTVIPDGEYIYLTGKPEELTTTPVDFMVTVKYTFQDNYEQERAVEETFPFSVVVVEEPLVQKGEFYVVFKTTEKNFLKGTPVVWHGAKVTAYEDGSFAVTPYNAFDFQDHTLPEEEEIEIDLPVIDPNHMYTAEEILDMQKQCYAIIKEQNEKLKLAETEYQIMERELGDGNVYAEIDGKVVSLLTEEEARQQKQPIVKVSGGGGFYIEGSVSELQRESLKLGQEVTINDWQNGGMYTGEVVSIGDFPSDNDNWNGMGNPTASYYPFKAFVSEDADLQAGSYVSMSYSTASAEQGIYLEKAFVRTEKGNSYIFVRGADGKLEKRPVKVGKVLWGSYYEILSPLGEEDCLAFPYGKNVKQGAPTVESDLNALYGY